MASEIKRNKAKQSAVAITLSFDAAIDGLLKVNPKSPVESKRATAGKKTAKKRPSGK